MRRSWKPARPNIWRLSISIRLTCPSTAPERQGGESGGDGVEVAVDASGEGVEAGQVVLSEGVEPVRETLALAVGEHDREGPDVSGECVEFWALGADGGAAEVAAVQCSAHDYTGPGKPRIAWNDEQARAELVDALVTDALRLLGHLPDQQLGDKAANAVGSLALVAGQDVEPAEDSDGRDGRWRITQGTVQERIVSTVDPEARHIHKTRSHRQDGYKAHLAVESETGLYTAVALRPCAGPEHHEAAVLDLLAEEDTPVDAFGDTAYSTGDARQAMHRAGHRLFLKHAPLRPAVPGGFTLDDFAIDTTIVTCLTGHTVPLSDPGGQHHQRKASFRDLCTGCHLREQCTKAKAGLILTIPTPPQPPDSRPPPTPAGRPTTAAGGHRSNVPPPGSSTTATGACAIAAPSRTTPGSTPGPPPSTSAD